MKIKVDNDITLHSIRIKSAREIYTCLDGSREFLREWLPFVDNTLSYKDTEEVIKSIKYARGAIKDIVFEVRFREELAGILGLKGIDLVNNKAEIGYWLGKEYTGKGIMTRSCIAAIDYAFEELQLNKLQIKCAVENIRSCNIPKQLGFLFEGIERQGERIRGKYLDLKVYSLLKKEWQR